MIYSPIRLALATLALAGTAIAPSASSPTGQAAQAAPADRNVAYLDGASADQRLDLYVPAARNFPTVMFIHGGSLQESGERRASPMYAPVCEPFVAAGIGCATIDYRLAPAARWPAMPDDAAAAVKWIKTHIAARGGNPGRLFVFGHSSGGHIAAILGANPKYLAKAGLAPADLAGVIAMGCVLAPLEETTAARPLDDLRALWPKSHDASTFATFDDRLDSYPSRFIGPHMPPTLVVLAEAERFFPSILEQGAKLVRRLLEMQRPADVVIVPGRHVTSIANIHQPDDPAFVAIRRFVADPAAAGRTSR